MTRSTEPPILFKAPMVRATLAGTKGQTRRVVTPHTSIVGSGPGFDFLDFSTAWKDGQADSGGEYLKAWYRMGSRDDRIWADTRHRIWPRIETGDRLWVREAWRPEELPSLLDGIRYRADNAFEPIANTKDAADDWVQVYDRKREGRWRPSIHMPKWAHRIVLEVTHVRVERVTAISELDARAEGIPQTAAEAHELGLFDMDAVPGHVWDNRTSSENFRELWDSINAGRGFPWKADPWVWVITFRRHAAPVWSPHGGPCLCGLCVRLRAA